MLSNLENIFFRMREFARYPHSSDGLPSLGWHSWDSTPWDHPWLSNSNLSEASYFDSKFLTNILNRFDNNKSLYYKYGFVGNLANNMAMRALPLRQHGLSIDLLLHPQDRSVMSQPGWELSEIELLGCDANIDALKEHGYSLPIVPNCFNYELLSQSGLAQLLSLAKDTPPRLWSKLNSVSIFRQQDVLLWGEYFSYLPLLKALQAYDCLFSAQSPYLAYLACRPYFAAQTGGDLWLDCSRNDSYGMLQRRAYKKASAILATNPWAYSNARRFGFNHVLYVPLLINTESYAPKYSEIRNSWIKESGGDFFALVTARIDRAWKGSEIGIEGFVKFAANNPNARLVLVGWGENSQDDIEELKKKGLDGRIIQLPVSGKLKLIEYLRSADCLIDQFKIGYYGATALEAMSTGVPVIMRLLTQQYDALCPTGSPPVLNAATSDQVSDCLQRLVNSEDTRIEISKASRQWVLDNHSVNVWGETYHALLNVVSNGYVLNFKESPLNYPLTKLEVDYHAANLLKAPTFPNYLI